ncbi:VOC family protein [Novosphingobium sp.]|uniref:VOC family protein n=1 Tax=Novosphingobium sp. TaxID=1874826 RepID=UPI0025D41789|nr:VOC family protein [Novosphingobium sp.]MCC6926009.1 VOC family protein [Novosphingobium sp.]
MATLQGSWIWYELMTPDVAGAKAFYDAVVGWSMAAGTPETNGYGFITAADGAMIGGVLELTGDMTANGARPCWLGYVGVDDVDASVAAIEASGGKVLMPARDVQMAGRIAMMADCCGAPFYVMTPTPTPGGGESTSFAALPNPGHCGWNELLAGNQQNAIGFYTGQFGWTLPDPMDMGPMGTYQFIAHDGVMVGAIMARPEAVPAPLWCHYFWVDGIEAAKGRIEAAGGQIVNGPHEVPGPLWVVQGVDPQGALFSLVGPR